MCMKNAVTEKNLHNKFHNLSASKNSGTFLKPVIDLKATGEQIKSLREKNGLSVRDLQKVFGFEYPQAIYAWEQGKSVPSIDNMLILAQIFNIELDEIVATSYVEISLPWSA